MSRSLMGCALAAILVVLFHSDPHDLVSGGFVGVDIFFVLSAYLITAILAGEHDSTGRIELVPFYLRRIVAVGKLSYGIYLWHYPIAYALRDQLGLGLTFAITFALSLLMAAISYSTVEAWGRRFNGRRRRTSSNSARFAS